MLQKHCQMPSVCGRKTKGNFYDVIRDMAGMNEQQANPKNQSKLLNEQRKQILKIPNSKHIELDQRKVGIVPNIENTAVKFTTFVRQKRKNKYNALSPAQYYQNRPNANKLESNTMESNKKPNYWMNMETPYEGREVISDTMNIQEIEMEEATIKDENIRQTLWKMIQQISEDIDLPIDEKREDPIEVLEEALERLEEKKALKCHVLKGLRNDQERASKMSHGRAPIVNPEAKRVRTKQKNEQRVVLGEAVEARLDNAAMNANTNIEHIEGESINRISTIKEVDGKINSENEHVCNAEGLNVNAENINITPSQKINIDACKPPEVEQTPKQTPIKHQLRHSYTARTRLHIVDSSVNLGLMLRKMFQLWKETDSSTLLLAHADETNHALTMSTMIYIILRDAAGALLKRLPRYHDSPR